jgi:hypothetical protein
MGEGCCKMDVWGNINDLNSRTKMHGSRVQI